MRVRTGLAIVALAMLVAPPTRASAQDFAPDIEELARVHALAQRYLVLRQVVVLLGPQG